MDYVIDKHKLNIPLILNDYTVDYNVYIAFCPQRGHKKSDKLDDTKNFQFKKGNRDRKVN